MGAPTAPAPDSAAGRFILRVALLEADHEAVEAVISACEAYGPCSDPASGFTARSNQDSRRSGSGDLTVAFTTKEDCENARAVLERHPAVLRAACVAQVSGAVLALTQHGGGAAPRCSAEHIRSMLSVFGPVSAAHRVTLPANSCGLEAHLFDFADPEHAAAAVNAIGDRPCTSFSLHVLDSSGAVVRRSCSSDHDTAMAGESLSVSLRTRTASSEASETASLHLALAQALPRPPSLPVTAPPRVSRMSERSTDGSSGWRSMLPPQLIPPHSVSLPFMRSSLGPSESNESSHLHNGGGSAIPGGLPLPQYLYANSDTQPATLQQFHLQPSISCPPTEGNTLRAPPFAPAARDARSFVQPPPPPPPPPAPQQQQQQQPQGGGDHLTDFDVNEAASGGPRARTTVMVRNIPCRWSGTDFLNVMAPVINGEWDLLYMPCKAAEVVNSGYAFLNFRSALGTLRLYRAMHGRRWPNTRSGKVCEIRYARIQGRQLLSHLDGGGRNSTAVFRGYVAYPDANGDVVMSGPDSRMQQLPPQLPSQLQASMQAPTRRSRGSNGGVRMERGGNAVMGGAFADGIGAQVLPSAWRNGSVLDGGPPDMMQQPEDDQWVGGGWSVGPSFATPSAIGQAAAMAATMTDVHASGHRGQAASAPQGMRGEAAQPSKQRQTDSLDADSELQSMLKSLLLAKPA